MPLAWNEIRPNAAAFAREWVDAEKENAEGQTFWNEFFAVFGVRRRTVAAFEEPVRGLSGDTGGRIDLLWPGVLLAEHKSRGRDLGRAESQAFDYITRLVADGRLDEVPRYVVVSDFARIALHDREATNPGRHRGRAAGVPALGVPPSRPRVRVRGRLPHRAAGRAGTR